MSNNHKSFPKPFLSPPTPKGAPRPKSELQPIDPKKDTLPFWLLATLTCVVVSYIVLAVLSVIS